MLNAPARIFTPPVVADDGHLPGCFAPLLLDTGSWLFRIPPPLSATLPHTRTAATPRRIVSDPWPPFRGARQPASTGVPPCNQSSTQPPNNEPSQVVGQIQFLGRMNSSMGAGAFPSFHGTFCVCQTSAHPAPGSPTLWLDSQQNGDSHQIKRRVHTELCKGVWIVSPARGNLWCLAAELAHRGRNPLRIHRADLTMRIDKDRERRAELRSNRLAVAADGRSGAAQHQSLNGETGSGRSRSANDQIPLRPDSGHRRPVAIALHRPFREPATDVDR